ncbi:butyrate kinase [Thermobrachium celere]|uniref:Probable butyrate kinase n=1 Tax=Thermobrachium celere DSM 8682 TaxID=941824 RepID=R7RQV0_9CLOT|nr:butyrate kinase [Thermobrachium celere]CDF57668.1 Butyrate kinase [Thermobrachium celere DSM 8682]
MRGLILAINPGSTSTKIAVFEKDVKVKQTNITHDATELAKYERIADQFEFRKQQIITYLNQEGIDIREFDCIVGRGGLLRPMPSGTYKVTEKMIEDLKIGYQGEHASNLGGIIAKSIADEIGKEAYIVDPVAVDEFEDIARISGIPEIQRRSLVHALNIKAVSRRVAKQLGKKLEDCNFIVAHLGGGISVAPLKRGRIVDVNNANESGPFSPERCGQVPVGDLVKLAFSGKYTYKELKKKMVGQAGLVGYLGTNDARVVEEMIKNGDEKAKLIFEAMCYQIGKEIGAVSTVLFGDVDRIILTGGLAYSERLVNYVTDMVKFIADVVVVPGEDEMQALAEGAYRVLIGEEKAKIYEEEVKI